MACELRGRLASQPQFSTGLPGDKAGSLEGTTIPLTFPERCRFVSAQDELHVLQFVSETRPERPSGNGHLAARRPIWRQRGRNQLNQKPEFPTRGCPRQPRVFCFPRE